MSVHKTGDAGAKESVRIRGKNPSRQGGCRLWTLGRLPDPVSRSRIWRRATEGHKNGSPVTYKKPHSRGARGLIQDLCRCLRFFTIRHITGIGSAAARPMPEPGFPPRPGPAKAPGPTERRRPCLSPVLITWPCFSSASPAGGIQHCACFRPRTRSAILRRTRSRPRAFGFPSLRLACTRRTDPFSPSCALL